jgi:hypothetical protein
MDGIEAEDRLSSRIAVIKKGIIPVSSSRSGKK